MHDAIGGSRRRAECKSACACARSSSVGRDKGFMRHAHALVDQVVSHKGHKLLLPWFSTGHLISLPGTLTAV